MSMDDGSERNIKECAVSGRMQCKEGQRGSFEKQMEGEWRWTVDGVDSADNAAQVVFLAALPLALYPRALRQCPCTLSRKIKKWG